MGQRVRLTGSRAGDNKEGGHALTTFSNAVLRRHPLRLIQADKILSQIH